MAEPFASDKDLMDYFVIHAKTERALFHVDHARRMLELAGGSAMIFAAIPADGFVAVHYDDWKDEIDRAFVLTHSLSESPPPPAVWGSST